LKRNANALSIVFLYLSFGSIAFLASANISFANQENDANLSAIIPELQSLSINSNLEFFTPGSAELITGVSRVNLIEVTVSSNTDWVLCIRGSDETWEGPWAKPLSDISWSFDGGEFIPLKTTLADVCMGGSADHQLCPISFKIILDPLKDIPGEYRYPSIIFELSAP
jgi:hypothetical protein